MKIPTNYYFVKGRNSFITLCEMTSAQRDKLMKCGNLYGPFEIKLHNKVVPPDDWNNFFYVFKEELRLKLLKYHEKIYGKLTKKEKRINELLAKTKLHKVPNQSRDY